MSKIVVITTPGSLKRDFVNTLQEESGGKVALVVLQRERSQKFSERILKFYRKVGLYGLLPELLCLFRIATSKRFREILTVTKLYTPHKSGMTSYLAPTMEVSNINDDSVHKRLLEINPDLIAIWGGLIVKPHIINTAKYALNIHTGYCPYYRGTNCNLNAILNNDLEHIGITIHNVVEKVDAGNIQAVVTVNTTRPPSIFFRELNDRAFRTYVDTILQFINGNPTEGVPQDLSLGKNYLLKDWTYQKQLAVAKILIGLERK